MLFLVIERFHPNKVKELYIRLDEEGRHLPEGVTYVNSWVDAKIETCYQVMECDTREQLQQWMDNWEGYCDWEVVPVMRSKEVREIVLGPRMQ